MFIAGCLQPGFQWDCYAKMKQKDMKKYVVWQGEKHENIYSCIWGEYGQMPIISY